MKITLVPTATAAFIAALSSAQMQRIVDDAVVSEPFVHRRGGRAFAVLTSAFAKFYFDTTMDLTREARLRYIGAMVERVSRSSDPASVFSLEGPWADIDWTIKSRALYIRFGDYVTEAERRWRLVVRAEAAVKVSPDVMGGEPVYAGTRVPIANVLASGRAGFDIDQLQTAYPFLTAELVEDAETYQTIHPRVGRPRKEGNNGASTVRRRLISREVITLRSRGS